MIWFVTFTRMNGELDAGIPAHHLAIHINEFCWVSALIVFASCHIDPYPVVPVAIDERIRIFDALNGKWCKSNYDSLEPDCHTGCDCVRFLQPPAIHLGHLIHRDGFAMLIEVNRAVDPEYRILGFDISNTFGSESFHVLH